MGNGSSCHALDGLDQLGRAVLLHIAGGANRAFTDIQKCGRLRLRRHVGKFADLALPVSIAVRRASGTPCAAWGRPLVRWMLQGFAGVGNRTGTRPARPLTSPGGAVPLRRMGRAGFEWVPRFGLDGGDALSEPAR